MNQEKGIWTGIVAIVVLGSLAVWLIAWGRPLNTFFVTEQAPAMAEKNASTTATASKPVEAKGNAAKLAVERANGDVLSIISNTSGISEFRSLLYSTGVASQISAATKYTIFVPTNAAFSRLPRGTITNLSTDERMRLVRYHLISGAAIDPTASVAGSTQTLSGDYLNFSSEIGAATMVGNARILAQYNGTNGTVYLIDSVLLPPKRAF